MLDQHKFLTNQIILWTKKHFNSNGLDISDDNQDKASGSRPTQINAMVNGNIRSCLPDFVARNIIQNPNLFILGEAKTSDDFLTRHKDADNQMNVMINFLRKQPKPILIYSIPNEFVKRITNDLQAKKEQFDANNVQIEIIDQFFK